MLAVVGVEEVEPRARDSRNLVLGLAAGADEEGGVLRADDHLHRGVLARVLLDHRVGGKEAKAKAGQGGTNGWMIDLSPLVGG